MQSNITGIARYGSRLLVADKKNVRCLGVDDGTSHWTRNFEDIYNAVPYRNGIFVTHKDSFFARTTYGSYLETDKPASLWISHGSSNFRKPLLTNAGELLLSYNGEIKMMPKTASGDAPANISIPGQKTPGTPDFWKNRNASEAQSLPAPPPATPTVETTSKAADAAGSQNPDDTDADKPAIPKEIAPPAVDDWNKKEGL